VRFHWQPIFLSGGSNDPTDEAFPNPQDKIPQHVFLCQTQSYFSENTDFPFNFKTFDAFTRKSQSRIIYDTLDLFQMIFLEISRKNRIAETGDFFIPFCRIFFTIFVFIWIFHIRVYPEYTPLKASLARRKKSRPDNSDRDNYSVILSRLRGRTAKQ
jgi:hypothetical protein